MKLRVSESESVELLEKDSLSEVDSLSDLLRVGDSVIVGSDVSEVVREVVRESLIVEVADREMDTDSEPVAVDVVDIVLESERVSESDGDLDSLNSDVGDVVFEISLVNDLLKLDEVLGLSLGECERDRLLDAVISKEGLCVLDGDIVKDTDGLNVKLLEKVSEGEYVVVGDADVVDDTEIESVSETVGDREWVSDSEKVGVTLSLEVGDGLSVIDAEVEAETLSEKVCDSE